jgi:glycosyltransferase involved in cell wall biosynthesis
MRVAVVGPIEPFRSGVARHTTALARALARRARTEVRVYSFSRQYPAWLFPGESDRASDASVPRDLDASFSIDSLNPLSWLRVAREIRAYGPDLVIAPAWTFFLSPCLTAILSKVRCPIVAVVHNVSDHDGGRVRSLISAMQLQRASAHVTHTRELAAGITRIIPDAHVIVHPHPIFEYPAARRTLPARAELELLMFGLIRPYKGLDVLLEAIARCAKPSLMLSVVGEPWQDPASIRAQVERLGLEGKVDLVLRYVPDAEAAEYFERADVVVLPYRSVTGSGVVPLAWHYGKPVVASDLPGFSELVSHGDNGWLVPPGDVSELARTLAEKVDRSTAASMQPRIRQMRSELTFEHFAEATLGAIDSAC